MKKTLLIVLIIMFNVSVGQIIVPDTSKMTNTEKMLWYQNEKKSPALAVFFNTILPSTGYAYAGDWKRGLVFKAIQVGSALSGNLIYGLNGRRSGVGISGYFEMGFYAITAATVFYEYYDVAKTTQKYNNQLFKNIFGKEPEWKVNLVPYERGIGLSLSYRF